jgi:lipopolysaccharide transport system ATP-binding protein
MNDTVIKVENLSKQYRLGQIGSGTLTNDLRVWWAKRRGRPNPLLKIGEQEHGNGGGENVWALKDVSFEVQQGEVLGIIGKNGAGKSTLLKILSRVTAPTAGQVKVKGRIASLLEVGTGFHPELTGRENIYLNGAILGMSRREIERKFDEIVDFSGVEQYIDTPVKRYSSGMYVRLAFAVAAHLEPEILVVDEVLAVGDAEFQKKCLGKMGKVAQSGRTVLFVSHQMAAIENLCSRSLLLKDGQIIEIGRTDKVINYYLGHILNPPIEDNLLLRRTDRRGSGQIKLTGFHIEDTEGNKLAAAKSGDEIVFVFGYITPSSLPHRDVDIGFSLHSYTHNQTLAVFYSSFVNTVFGKVPNNGLFKCKVPKLPFAPGRYRVGARIVVDGVEADWPQDGVGFLDVESGDFYGSGRKGFEGNTPFLFLGEWQVIG